MKGSAGVEKRRKGGREILSCVPEAEFGDTKRGGADILGVWMTLFRDGRPLSTMKMMIARRTGWWWWSVVTPRRFFRDREEVVGIVVVGGGIGIESSFS